MARNINIKLNSLKINTNMENLYESKYPQSVKNKNGISTSIKPVNFTSIIANNFNSNINKYYNNDFEKFKQTGQRSNSRSGTINNNNQNNKLLHNMYSQIKSNTEVENTNKLYHISALSPKTPKNNIITGNNKINLNCAHLINHVMPISTRNSVNPNVKTNSIENYNQNIGHLKKQPSKSNESSSYIKINKENNFVNNNNNLEIINVMTLLGSQNQPPITLKNLDANIPNYDSSKYSVKSMSIIKAYAANTHQGIIRNYNEDRVSIILNIIKPSTFKGVSWPKCSYFGIYDGHGGALCADFLRDSLHQFIIKDSNFPNNIKEAIRKGFENAEKEFISKFALNKNGDVLDRSGSCAIVTLIVDNVCYVANVGDSRVLMSLNGGTKYEVLTNDHKPNEYDEKKRIVENGGKVYQTQTPAKNINFTLDNINSNQILVGPHRVYPGRLSVSRTFGDVEAKLTKLGGLPNVITAIPEITSFEIRSNMDFIVMGCDGIFDTLSNQEIIDCVWMTTKYNKIALNIHSQCGLAVDMILKSSLVRRSLDNVTSVIISFSNFEKLLKNDEKENIDTKYIALNTEPNKRKSFVNSKSEIQNLNYLISPTKKNDYLINYSKNKKEDLKNNNPIRYDTYSGNINSNSSEIQKGIRNLDNYKNGLVDNQIRKTYIQKKLVSLDLSSNKKDNHPIINSEKDYHFKKRLDYSELIDKDKRPISLMRNETHPMTTKNSQVKIKDKNLFSSIKKISSLKI